jgi:hypothetical protein
MTCPTYHKELIDGLEIEKALPKNLHAFAETFLLVDLATRLPRLYEALPELNVLCGADRTKAQSKLTLAEMWSELD